jgi:dTDP-4-dehydrorhamnose 3,5-epimerase
MDVTELAIPGLKLLRPKKLADARGFFSEVYNARAMQAAGIDTAFVQDNQSYSTAAGTIRGLHFQLPPHAQAKLVRVVRGRVLDVAVDLRRGSPTYARHVSVELSAESWTQLLIPVGFAHGFCTLEPDTEVFYKVSAHYAPEADAGVAWNDPDLAISWPLAAAAPVLSDKDLRLPRLRDFETPF